MNHTDVFPILVSFVVGSVFTYLAIKEALARYDLLVSGVRTNGTVNEVVRKEKSGDTFYYPVFEFYDQSNVKHLVEAQEGSWPSSYNKGDKVSLVYDPKNPENLSDTSFFGLYTIALLFASMAVIALAIGLNLLI